MKIFISWSGRRSREAAEGLRNWLPDVIQAVKPWISSDDIQAGSRWFSDVGNELSNTNFGIICLTKENQRQQWLMFEAGAIAKSVNDSFVVPYLIGMEPNEVKGPLKQFQAKRSNEQETLELVSSINSVVENGRLEASQLQRVFDRSWPVLQKALENLPEPETSEEVTLSDPERRRAVSRARELGTSINEWLESHEKNNPFVNADNSIWSHGMRDPEQQRVMSEYDKYQNNVTAEYRQNFLRRVIEVHGELAEHDIVNSDVESNYENPRNEKQIRKIVQGLWEMAGRLERTID